MEKLPKPESKADQEAMQAALSGLLRTDATPDDEQAHALGEKTGVAPDKIEETAYAMLADAQREQPGKHRHQPASKFDQAELRTGTKVEREHTDSPDQAREIAKDHLAEIPDYYTRLTAMENTAKRGEAKKSLVDSQGGPAVLPIGKHEGTNMLQDWLAKAQGKQESTDLNKGDLTPEKARKILHDGTAHGQPITEQQRKYFGAVASGSAVQKSDVTTWPHPAQPRKPAKSQDEPEQPAQEPAGPSEEDLIGDVATDGIENPATTIEGDEVLEAGPDKSVRKGIIQTPMAMSQDAADDKDDELKKRAKVEKPADPELDKCGVTKSFSAQSINDWLKAQQLSLFGGEVAGHKYIKRTGGPGHYQYTYPDEQGGEHKFDQVATSPEGNETFAGPKGALIHGKVGEFKTGGEKAPEAKPAEPEVPKAGKGAVHALPKGGNLHRVPAHLHGLSTTNEDIYGDSGMLQNVGQLGAGFNVRHLGFGEFEVETPKGVVQFDRGSGKDFEGQHGRSHLLHDNAHGEAINALVTAMGGDPVKSWKKSMSGLAGLEDYMRKSEGLPTGEPGFSQGVEVAKPKDGGQLEGVGHTGADTGHTSAETTIGDPPRQPEHKLSADDAAAAEAMKLHKKPLEESVHKSDIGWTQQEGMHIYNEGRQERLQKAERERFAAENVVHTGPIERPQPPPDPIIKGRTWQQGRESVAVYSDQADRECFELLKGDGFYQDGGPVGQLRKSQLDQVDLCKACHEAKPSYLTACPHCGDGTTMNRVVPAELGGEMLEKSERGQLHLRDVEICVYAPDGIKIDE
jgi:hypothetical protein